MSLCVMARVADLILIDELQVHVRATLTWNRQDWDRAEHKDARDEDVKRQIALRELIR